MCGRLVACILAIALFTVASPARATDKVALVIGNNAYRHGGALANPINDARAVAAALQRRGFDLGPGDEGLVLDTDKGALERALRNFRIRSQGARLAVIYYSGHGVQIDGINLLVPVDARLEDVSDADLETVRLEAALSQMRGTVNAVILDACRNNPFGDRLARSAGQLGRSLGASRGMARIDSRVLSGGSVVALAAMPGEVAFDGTGRNSPYAAALIDVLDHPPTENPQLDLRKLFAAVREEVERTTDGKQRPEVVDRLPSRDVFLLPPPATATATATQKISNPRLANDRWVALEPGESYRLPVLDNDSGTNGGRLRVVSLDGVQRGRAEISEGGQSLTYTAPLDGGGGEVSFEYSAQEDGGGVSNARVTLVLTSPPAPNRQDRPGEPEKPIVSTIVTDRASKAKIMGNHGLTLQWLDKGPIGRVAVTEKNGIITLKGRQGGYKRHEDDFVSLDGVITEINDKEFFFDGEINMKIYHINGGNICTRSNKVRFAITENRKYWRMREPYMKNPCDDATDYIDIYF
ncbi:caspase family protein [Azospirillum agricola]|uniref:caspase family protein n=1 Tax=Azospirillum agricola TaxID=1720247 RepID=UPI000A0F1D51|nr:caspase family protein [Azospirillum agricola]SMH57928.1 Caspase domain-containing protein [Azospirillum lipoferum]